MENKLEQLLNSLIKRGRVPFGDEKIHSFEMIYVTGKIWNIVARRGRGQVNKHYSIIELCSKLSGLWQFVCENGMIKSNGYCNGWAYHNSYDEYDEGDGMYDELPRYYDTDYQYRVIESSLKDESELESFILDKIKIEGQQHKQ